MHGSTSNGFTNIKQLPALLCTQADKNQDGKLSLNELRTLLADASNRFSHLAEHAQFLDSKAGGLNRWGGMVSKSIIGSECRPG
jgi:hypothetical protein